MRQLAFDFDERPHTVLAIAAIDAAVKVAIETVHNQAFANIFNQSLANDFVAYFRERLRERVGDLTQVEVVTNYPRASQR